MEMGFATLSCLPLWESSTAGSASQARKIEESRPGYPRFSALIAAHNPFFIYRKFSQLHARVLLLKQDKLSLLEKRLEQTDNEERSQLFLGKSRSDRNADRISLLSEIEAGLVDYDQFAERTSGMLTFSRANPRDVRSLRNWVDGTGCLAREETEYLNDHRELMTLAPLSDIAIAQTEAWVEDKLIQFWSGFRKWKGFGELSLDENVYIYSGSLVPRLAKALLFSIITLMLLMPVLICNTIGARWARLAVVMLSTIVFLLAFSGLTKSRTVELILSAVTYTTVLIVFASGTSIRN